jgi:putative Ca2+/H+ antiporter (TMEM165/GDT1 family)
MAKFFLALIGISVATLVGTFVFAAFALQATHLLARTTVAMRETPTFIMHDVEATREGDRKKTEWNQANRKLSK